MFAMFSAFCILQQNKTQISILDLQGNFQCCVIPPNRPSAASAESKEFRLSISTLKQIELMLSTWAKNMHKSNWENISSNLGMKNLHKIFASFPLPAQGPAGCAAKLPSTWKTQKPAKTGCLTKMVLVSYLVCWLQPLWKILVEMGIFPK